MELVKVNSAPSLLTLNDDCLLCIFNKLNLLEQLRVANLHPHLKTIIKEMWRMRVKHVNLSQNLPPNSISDDELLQLMVAIGDYMQSLIVRHMSVTRLRVLGMCLFRRTVEFDWVDPLGERDDFQFSDEDVLLLQCIMPNLRSLKLRSCQITGKHIEKFSHLEKLCLHECQYLADENFETIFKKMKLIKFDIMEDCDELNFYDLLEITKCETLQHIKIADYHLCYDADILHDIMHMPNLRKLSIYSKNFIFDVVQRITKQNIKQIVGFKYNGSMHTRNFERFLTEIGRMQKLRKLVFQGCRTYDADGLCSFMLGEVSKQLPQLRELHLCSCDLESDAGVLSFVRNCRDLTLINLIKTYRIRKSFIWHCIEILAEQNWRKEPVKLWIRYTDIDESIFKDPYFIKNSSYVSIDMKKTCKDTNPPGVVKLTFEV